MFVSVGVDVAEADNHKSQSLEEEGGESGAAQLNTSHNWEGRAARLPRGTDAVAATCRYYLPSHHLASSSYLTSPLTLWGYTNISYNAA